MSQTNNLRTILSAKNLAGKNINTRAFHIGRQLLKAMDAAGVATHQELFHAYIQQNPLNEAEWIEMLFTAADIVDDRRPFCPSCLCCLTAPGQLGIPNHCEQCGAPVSPSVAHQPRLG